MSVVLSGVQPTGALHLGNYLGAIKRFASLQDTADCLFCVVDLHAITVKQDPCILASNTRAVAAAYLACGIDPSKSSVFVQSSVPQHAELAWVLNCVARTGWLDRMTQFREKTGSAPNEEVTAATEILADFMRFERDNLLDRVMRMPIGDYGEVENAIRVIIDTIKDRRTHKEKASVGLYTYPVLQAADILLYQATHVPVGDDQKQHLNLAGDIAKKFNADYGDIFPIPSPLIGATGTRVMDLKTGTTKMSKSNDDDSSRINLTDSDDIIARKIKRATADSRPIPETIGDLDDMPAVRNLLTIMAAMRDISLDAVLAEYEGKGYGVFKPDLTEVLVTGLGPIRRKMSEYQNDTAYVDCVLLDGQAEAIAAATKTMTMVKEAIGFWDEQ